MSAHVNLFLVVNLGSEMLYVINQRLLAQDIGIEKSKQVLRDITGVLLNPRLLNSLSTTKILQSHKYIFALMSDVACCSIMRLDKHSMGKLWDLMVMIYKWQISLTNETCIFDITCRHIRGICKLNPEPEVIQLTNNTIDIFRRVWLKLSPKQIIQLRENLLSWLRQYRVKVTLLLRLGLQNIDGSFLLNPPIEKYGSILSNLGSNIYIDYDHIQPIQNEDRSESIDSSSERGDFLDLKALVDELLGACEVRKSNLPSIDLNFSENVKEEKKNELIHQFESKADNLDELHQIYGEMSVEERNLSEADGEPSTSVQQQLLDMLDSDEE